MLPRAVSEHYRAQQRLIVATLGLTRREWSAMDIDNLDASWAKIAPRINLLTTSAQLGAASSGAAYVAATLDEFGDGVDALADVNPRAFAGIASDGRPLPSLLDGAMFRAKQANSLEAGGKWLDMAVHTQVADAGRGAAATAIAARPGVKWVRMVNPPCCGPCAVLSGKEFRYNQGFQRHPRCDCIHVPTTDIEQLSKFGLTTEPNLSQITDLTDGERKALLEGADLSRVVNARRGGGIGKMSTTELAKRGQVRLTPDGIFASTNDRAEALRLLQSHGYITPTARKVTASTAKVPAVAKPTFNPKWREGRDVHVRKLADPAGRRALADTWRGAVRRSESDRAAFEASLAEREQFILGEGLSKRQVAAIMKKQPDVQRWRAAIEQIDEGLATARRQLDEIERDLAGDALPDFDPENPLKFYGDRYTFHDESETSIRWAKDWETFDEDLHVLMRDHFAEVDDSGVFVGGDRNLTDVDDLQRLKSIEPRGHGSGRTYDDIGGVYAPSQRVCGCSHRAWFSDTHSTALHEGSHVIDDALGRVSSSPEWKAAHEAIPMRDWLNPYYRATGNPEGYLSESWAESMAAYQRGRNEGLSGDDLAEFVGRALGINPRNTISGENAAILTGRPLVEAVRTLLRRVK